MDDDPIACRLSADGLARRLADMAAVGERSLIGVEGSADRPVLRFADDAETRRGVEAIVAAEAACCAFLDLELVAAVDGLRLTIGGPAEAAPLIGELVAAFRGRCA